MLSIIYISRAVRPLNRQELAGLLTDARDRNRRTGVTGLLLYCEGRFLQLIEGPDEAIDCLFAAIGRDSRHREVTLIAREACERRAFATWNMAFEQLTTPEWATVSSEIRQAAQALAGGGSVEPGRVRAILGNFWHARPAQT